MTRLAKPEKKAGKGTTNGAECTPNDLARQLGRNAYRCLYTRDLQELDELGQ
jgi:hypothetical protein